MNRHTVCRACGSKDLATILDLGHQPPANAFSGEHEVVQCYPLELLACQACSLPQLSYVVDPNILYSNYPYITSRSATINQHLEKLFDFIAGELVGSVLEIGSNDGYVLQKLIDRGFGPVVGIDPADNLCEIARKENLPCITGPFNSTTAQEAWEKVGEVEIVLARHVFCHVDNWKQFLTDLHLVTHQYSIVCIEVPYFGDTVQNLEFDQIYHEHLSYMTLGGMQAALKGSGWEMINLDHFKIHGGSLAIILGRTGIHHPKPVVAAGLMAEKAILNTSRFTSDSLNNISIMQELVSKITERGQTVCGFGASAKSTVWINACLFGSEEVKFICDNTPQKIGKFSPGSAIPIVPESQLMENRTDYCILFAWNFSREIIQKQSAYLRAGGTFIIPGAEIRLFNKQDLQLLTANA